MTNTCRKTKTSCDRYHDHLHLLPWRYSLQDCKIQFLCDSHCEQCLATHAKDTISGVRTILKPSRIPSPISMLLSMQNILYQRLTLVWYIVNAVLWIQNIQHSIILTSVQIRTRANCKVTSRCCEEYTIRLVAVVLYEFSNV